MKLKEGFILRTVAGETVALPAGGVTNLDMMITLNGTAKFLWEILANGAENPMDILPAVWFVSACSLMLGIFAAKIFYPKGEKK